MQALTRNPLADPGILGVTSGAAFAVAMGVVLLGVTRPSGYVWFAFGGALLATVAVYLVGSAGRSNAGPIQLTLAGVALSAVLTGVVGALRLTDQERFAVLLTWESGSFQARGWDVVLPVLPFVLLGLVVAGLVAGGLNTLGRPLVPCPTSNSTDCPSSRLRYPLVWMALKWTNRSWPPSAGVMNP
jgi:iron complex transport system permease protein